MVLKISPLIILLFSIGLIIGGCVDKSDSPIQLLTKKSGKKITGKVVLSPKQDYNFYEIQSNMFYYSILQSNRNNLLEIYNSNNDLIFSAPPRKNSHYIPRFIRKEAHQIECPIAVYHNIFKEWETFQQQPDGSFSKQIEKAPDYYFNFGEFPVLAECVKTEKGIYGVQLKPKYTTTFYFFPTDSDVIFGEPYLNMDKKFNRMPLAYSCHIGVNEKEERIVTASHFTNTIHFYDPEANLKKVIIYGKETIEPVVTSKREIDVEKSRKCFIGTVATPKYVYCLYSGVADVLTQPCQILIFNWKGKHIKTLQTDRPLTAFSVDPDNKTLLGISRTEIGTEVVQYHL